MKILSCHIENYGTLSNKDYNFSDGLTCIMQENGAGKTTLASFIKAMFYGLPSYSVRAKNFDDRQHFYPFNGGKFGGNLTFEMGGSTYRIERIFDKKSETRDETKVYMGGKEYSGFGDDIGKKIFGLDLPSFERTVFITSDEVGGSSWDINAKLNRDVCNEGDDNFNGALKTLESKRKDIKADRGKGGLLDVEKSKLIELKNRIEDLKLVEKGLEASYEKRAELEKEIDGLSKKYKEESDLKALRVKKATYDGYIDDLNEKLNQIKQFENLPAESVLEELNGQCREYSANLTLIANAEKQLDGMGENKKFEGLEEEKLQHISGCMEKYRKADALLKVAAPAVEEKSKSPLPLIGLILAILLIGAGICLAFVNLYAGIALLAAGIILIILDGFLYLKGRMDGQSVQRPADLSVRQEMAEAETEVRAFLAPLGYYSDSAVADYTSFAADYENYKNVLSERQKLNEQIDGLKSRNIGIEDNVQAVLAGCGLSETGDICAAIADLLQKRKRLDGLKEDAEKLKNRAEKYKADNDLDNIVIPEETGGDSYEELRLKRGELASLDREIAADEADTERLPALENERDALEEKIKYLEHKREILSLTEKYLKQAESELKARYVSPIKDRFDYYAEKIKKTLGGSLKMDENFSLTFESGGEIRSERHLSSGLKSVCGLCIRFALVDNMYRDEKPFVVMDDPLINLDGKNMGGVAEILKELSGDMQIIYFTCHVSREVK